VSVFVKQPLPRRRVHISHTDGGVVNENTHAGNGGALLFCASVAAVLPTGGSESAARRGRYVF